MAKQKESLFPSAAILVRSGNGSFDTGALTPYVTGSSSKQEQQIAAEAQKHLLIIYNKQRITDAAIREMRQLHQHGSDEFSNVAAHMTDLNEQAAGKEHEGLVREFNRHNAELAANHFIGAMKVGAHKIAEVIDYPIDLPVVEEKKGWRLFGG